MAGHEDIIFNKILKHGGNKNIGKEIREKKLKSCFTGYFRVEGEWGGGVVAALTELRHYRTVPPTAQISLRNINRLIDRKIIPLFIFRGYDMGTLTFWGQGCAKIKYS